MKSMFIGKFATSRDKSFDNNQKSKRISDKKRIL